MCCHSNADNIPFFTTLDYRSKIMICSKLVLCSYKPYDIKSIDSDESGAGACITIEGQRGADMYIVISGRVAAVQDHEVLGYLEQRGFFCENCTNAFCPYLRRCLSCQKAITPTWVTQ